MFNAGFFLLNCFIVVSFAVLDFRRAALGVEKYFFFVPSAALAWYTATNFTSEYGAIVGAFQWNWFAWLAAIKLPYFAFVASRSHKPVLSAFEAYVLPLPYIFLMIRATPQLFAQGPNATRFALFTDTVLVVLSDLYDSILLVEFVLAAVALDTQPKLALVILYAAMGCVCALWVLHGTTFPRAGSSYSEDIVITCKTACLTSVLLCNTPFVLARLAIWWLYPVAPGLQGLLFKNALCIPLWLLRFQQCRRLRPAPSTETSSGPSMLNEGIDRPHSASTTTELTRKTWPQSLRREATVLVGRNNYDLSLAVDWTKLPSLAYPASNQRRRSADSALELLLRKQPTAPARRSHLSPATPDLANIVAYIEARRELPIRAFDLRSICSTIWQALKYGASADWMQHLSSRTPTGTRLERVMLILPVFAKHALVIAYYLLMPAGLLRSRFELTGKSNWTAFSASLTGVAFGVSAIVDCVCYTAIAPFREVLAAALVNAHSYWCHYVYIQAVHYIIAIANQPASIRIGKLRISIRLILLSIPPLLCLYRILIWLPIDAGVSFGRVTHVGFNKRREPQCCVLAPPGLDPSEAEERNLPVASLLLFRLAVHHYPPLSVHRRLARGDARNILKAVRLSDHLLQRGRYRLLVKSGCLVACGALHWTTTSWVEISMSLVVSWLYYGLGRAAQLLSLRSTELSMLMTQQIARQKAPRQINRRRPLAAFVCTVDVATYLEREQLFTSPGDLF